MEPDPSIARHAMSQVTTEVESSICRYWGTEQQLLLLQPPQAYQDGTIVRVPGSLAAETSYPQLVLDTAHGQGAHLVRTSHCLLDDARTCVVVTWSRPSGFMDCQYACAADSDQAEHAMRQVVAEYDRQIKEELGEPADLIAFVYAWTTKLLEQMISNAYASD